jgi:ribonuclease HII
MYMKMDEFHFIKILSKGIKNKKDWRFEKNILKKYKTLVSIDEAGRGALAGPLSLGALFIDKTSLKILEKNKIFFLDSKEVSEEKREIFLKIIKKTGIPYKKIFISNKKIDKLGIGKAYILGIEKIRSFFNPEILILDGKENKNIKEAIFVIKGDKKLNSLGGASIVAKVYRDRFMKRLAKKISFYKWEINKGYGTKEHLEAIKKIGISDYHRKSFLKKLLG